MFTLPFRILATVAFALFFASKWVRRGVAAVVVSAVLVGAQNHDTLQALAGGQSEHLSLLQALASLAGG